MTGPQRVLSREARANAAAAHAAIETLLNCYMREYAGWHVVAAEEVPRLTQPGDTHLAVLPFGEHGTLLVGLRHRSPTLRHRFRLPAQIVAGGGEPRVAPLALVADLITGSLDRPADRPVHDPAPLLARIRASVDAVATFLAAREDEIDTLWSARPLRFCESEQALLLGHMLHPTPKSRSEMSDAEVRAYSPETAARFQLHWLAVDAGLVEHDSATGTPAPRLTERLLRDDPAVDPAALEVALAGLGERVLIPAHPWELAHLRAHDAVVAALLADGAIVDLGPLGSPVAPTTSLRTVCRPDWPWQLKFSLHVRVTNSQRVTLPKELLRAVEAARLLQTPVGERAARIAPGLVMLQDPAYLAVRHGGELIDGLSVLLRDNRWRGAAQAADVSALTTLCQDHPYGGRSRLGAIVTAIAEREGRSEPDVAREWFERYCDLVLVSLLRLFMDLGLCMEPHAQNVLLELDEGWPARAVYRDSQGYFHREAAHARMTAIVPGIGEASESIFPEALADERLVYYPFRQQRAGRRQRARRGRRRRRARAARRPARAARARAQAGQGPRPGTRDTRRRCWTACSTTPPGRARPTCARACTTWTS